MASAVCSNTCSVAPGMRLKGPLRCRPCWPVTTKPWWNHPARAIVFRANVLLEVEHETVSFSGFKALDNVSMTAVAASVQVVIGPNGAGKSTLMDTIIGRVRPERG